MVRMTHERRGQRRSFVFNFEVLDKYLDGTLERHQDGCLPDDLGFPWVVLHDLRQPHFREALHLVQDPCFSGTNRFYDCKTI